MIKRSNKNLEKKWISLRAKSLLALLIACLLAFLPAGMFGWQITAVAQDYFGKAYVRNYTLLNRQKILAPIYSDLVLSQRFADSVVTRSWLLDETNSSKKQLFFEEAAGFAKVFRSHSYFISSTATNDYYLINKPNPDFNEQPSYQLNPSTPDDSWFFNSIKSDESYNINVDADPRLHTTRIWFNILVKDKNRKLGIVGTGIELTEFINDFMTTQDPGLTPMILDTNGAIQAHPDVNKIAYNSATGADNAETRNLLFLMNVDAEREMLKEAMQQAQRTNEVTVQWVTLDGQRQLLALAYIAELKWFLATAVDMSAAEILKGPWLHKTLLAFTLMLVILLAALFYAVERVIIKPLRSLQNSAKRISEGNYTVFLPSLSNDEIGDLNRAFGVMADKVKQHTEQLENLVNLRTRKLEESNQEIKLAHKKINDSINYASLIQKAILPNHQLTEFFGDNHFVLWKPRDVVGGDFYIFHNEKDRFLLGIVDCAGHGVPGALMTMLARAALDYAINEEGISSPAKLLKKTDITLRNMLQNCAMPHGIATNMDVGLAFVDPAQKQIIFAGAKIAFYYSNGISVKEIKGRGRALLTNKQDNYEDIPIDIVPDMTCYMTTDGCLDQAGGTRGFGFGKAPFIELLQTHAKLPLSEQANAIMQAIDTYRGDHPQRDDMTILFFKTII